MKRVTIHLDEIMLDWIDQHRKGTRAEFIRKALEREYMRLREVHREIERLQNEKNRLG
jgi:Arc/MetJ-type ribon-helix-helix transcriptional regulator